MTPAAAVALFPDDAAEVDAEFTTEADVPVLDAEPRFDLDLDAGVPLATVLATLARVGGVNVVAGEDVTGTVTATLHGVTAEEVLTALGRAHGFTHERSGNMIFVRSLGRGPGRGGGTPGRGSGGTAGRGGGGGGAPGRGRQAAGRGRRAGRGGSAGRRARAGRSRGRTAGGVAAVPAALRQRGGRGGVGRQPADAGPGRGDGHGPAGGRPAAGRGRTPAGTASPSGTPSSSGTCRRSTNRSSRCSKRSTCRRPRWRSRR